MYKETETCLVEEKFLYSRDMSLLFLFFFLSETETERYRCRLVISCDCALLLHFLFPLISFLSSNLLGLGLLLFQLFIYPLVERNFGPVMVSRIGAVCP